jgi:putative nucleotidyltransferase with HDIG domain
MNNSMKEIKIPYELKKMNAIFKDHGFEAYLVGGAVRDMLLGKPATDWDIATNATPQQVMSVFHRVIPTGIAHGTVTVHFLGNAIEVTTYRTDGGYTDGRHPDTVFYAATIQDDLSRRDFTMNAIAVSLENGSIVDPFDGQSDIKNKLIRSVGDPVKRFTEDGLRPVRALRFVSQLDFSIQKDTYSAIFESVVQEKTRGISVERLRDELIKILKTEKPSEGIGLMETTGILNIFIPEFQSCRNCSQRDFRGFHEFDVMDHLLYSCDGAPQDNLIVRLAALFHDIGKPAVKKIIPTPQGDTYTFYNHEAVGATMTKEILSRLRFPNAVTDRVVHLIRQHMFHYENTWTDAAVRRFLVRVKPEFLDDLFALRLADIYGMHNQPARIHDTPTGRSLCELQDRITAVIEQCSALGLKDLAVNGRDLLAAGIPSGRHLGTVLDQLLETVLDDPSQNTRDILLPMAKKIYISMFMT